MNPNSYEYRQLASLFHRRGDGFLLDSDLPDLVKIDRLFPCLVRCGGCRFTCAAQDVNHLVSIVTKEGSDHVRDVSMMMNPPPPKPGPYGSWERLREVNENHPVQIVTAHQFVRPGARPPETLPDGPVVVDCVDTPKPQFTVPTGGIANTDPMAMSKTNFEAWFACLTDGPEKAEIRRKRDAVEALARKELAKLEEDAKPVRRDYFDLNAPKGYGGHLALGRTVAIRMSSHRTFGAPYMGDNGPTGHGDICHSDADPGL